MTSNYDFTEVSVVGMSRTLHAPIGAHPAAAMSAAAAIAATRKRRAAGTTAASVNRGSI